MNITIFSKNPNIDPVTFKMQKRLIPYKYRELVKPYYDGDNPSSELTDVLSTYINKVLKKRWPEAEKFIIKDPYFAIQYINSYIHKRLPEAEPYIMKYPETINSYCEDIIKGRWADGEKMLLSEPIPYYLYYYAYYIIGKRWPEAEPYIMESTSSIDYAKGLIMGPWPEAEPHILKLDVAYIYSYVSHIRSERWPEAESIIIQYPQWAFCYAFNVLHKRWLEAEPMIFGSSMQRMYAKAFKIKAL